MGKEKDIIRTRYSRRRAIKDGGTLIGALFLVACGKSTDPVPEATATDQPPSDTPAPERAKATPPPKADAATDATPSAEPPATDTGVPASATHAEPATSTLAVTETPLSAENVRYPWHENITASVFWIGEAATGDNDFIHNFSTAWATDGVGELGCIDDPDNRDPQNPSYPANCTEKKGNFYYFALPALEYDENGLIPGARESSPWAGEYVPSGGSLFKNRWLETRRVVNGQEYVCYGQWEDVGPAGQNGNLKQYDYVFGTGKVDNNFRLGAGIDMSPAAAIALGMDTNVSQQSGTVRWRFVDEKDVPDGPWKEIVTTGGPKWD